MIPDLDHSLFTTMQLRLNDVTVNNVPRFLTEKPTRLTHSFVILTDNSEHPYVNPITHHGVVSSFPTRKPTVEKFESLSLVILMSEDPAYNPHDTSIVKHEDALNKAVLETGDCIGSPLPRQLCPVSKTLPSSSFDGPQLSQQQISIVHDDAMLYETMQANISTVRLASSGPQLTPQVLATNWGMDLKTAAQTVKATTQRGIRTVLYPTLSRRFRTNDRQLRYRQLPIDWFTDTLFSNTTSRRNNKCAQIFATADGWCRAFPMSKKSLTHKGLSLLL